MLLDQIFSQLLGAWFKVIPYLINLFAAGIVLLAGILFSKMIQLVIIAVFKSVPLDEFLRKNKLVAFLEKAEIRLPASELLGNFAYWLSVLVLVLTVANFLNLPVDPLIDRVISYLGIVFLAALVLGLGVFFSTIISGIIYIVGANIGIPGAKTIARLMQYATVIFSFLLALEQLGIGPALIVPSIGVIIGAVGLAVAIAFGLGCKDIMADFVSNLIRGK